MRCAVRYFTDFIDGSVLSRDDDGLEFCGRQEACRSAAEALVEVASDTVRTRHKIPFGSDLSGLHLQAQVRNEMGTVVFRAHLTLALDWPEASSAQG